MKIIILLLWVLIFVPAFNYLDYHVTKDGGKPNYIIYFIVRGIMALVHGIVYFAMFLDVEFDYSFMSSIQLLTLLTPFLVFWTCSFWVVYELIRNAWSHPQDLLYYDHQEKDSGWIDKLFAWCRTWGGDAPHVIAKVTSALIAIESAIIIIKL